jgi:hypothetical protein
MDKTDDRGLCDLYQKYSKGKKDGQKKINKSFRPGLEVSECIIVKWIALG